MTERKLLGYGSWKGHPKGPFEITPENIDAAIAYFNRRNVRIPVNYEHDRKRSAGWIVSVSKKDDGMYGFVDYTSQATDDIKDSQYPYISPELLFGVPDEVTGEPVSLQIVGQAITKTPFMHDLGETILNHKDAVVLCSYDIDNNEVKLIKGEPMQELVDKINAALEALGMEPIADPLQAIAKIEEFGKAAKGLLAAMPTGEGGAPPSPEAATEALPELVANSKVATELSKTLDCKPGELKSKLDELQKSKPKEEKEVTELSKKVDDQGAEILNLNKELKESRYEAFLILNSKKITPAMQKEGTIKEQFMENEKFVVNFYKTAPNIITDARSVLNEESTTLTELEKTAAKAAGLSDEDYLKGSGPEGANYFANKKNGGE